MVGRMTRRLLVGGVTALMGAVTVAFGPTAASADGPDQITITGDDLAEPLEVTAEDYPELYAALHSEVNWLIDGPSQAKQPKEERLGPHYQLVVYADGEARHQFDLYPLARGGPRAHRPAEQPGDRKVRAGWFYGRLSMPDTLVSAGVPLSGNVGPSGGIGGGDPAPTEEPATAPGVSDVLDEWREGMRITVAVTLAIVIGLVGVAVAIRRKA